MLAERVRPIHRLGAHDVQSSSHERGVDGVRRPGYRKLFVHYRADDSILADDDHGDQRRTRGVALKTIDPKAFQAVVDAAAAKLMVPGAMVLLRTPQGNFTAAVGTTELGAQTPPARTLISGSPRTPRP